MARTASGAPRRTDTWRTSLLGFDRNIYLLLLFTLGKGFQLSIAALSINLYAHSLGYSLSFIGLLTAMPALGSFLSAVPVGLLADRIGRKPLLILSGFLNPLAIAAIGLSTSAPFLLGASIANGVLSTAYWVTNIPILTESTPPERRVWVLSLNNFLLLGIGAVGSLLGGAVPELVSGLLNVSATSSVPLRWGVIAAAIAVFLPALPLIFLKETAKETARGPAQSRSVAAPLRETPPVTIPHAEAPAEEETGGRWGLTILFLKLLVPDALYSMGLGAALGLLQLFFFLRFAVQPGGLGVLYTTAGVLGGIASLTAPRIARRAGKLRTATLMQWLAVPLVLAIGFAPVFVLAAGADIAYNILAGVFAPVYAVFTMERVTARHRATLSGFYSVTWSIGFTSGPALAGWLQQRAGLSAGFVVSAVCIGAAATLLRLFFGRHDRPAPDPRPLVVQERVGAR